MTILVVLDSAGAPLKRVVGHGWKGSQGRQGRVCAGFARACYGGDTYQVVQDSAGIIAGVCSAS